MCQNQNDGYVCGFFGKRDSYQVPIALAENNRLSAFVTDIYVSRLVAFFIAGKKTLEKISDKYDPRIPSNLVNSNLFWKILFKIYLMRGESSEMVTLRFDEKLSKEIEKSVVKTNSNIFLYTTIGAPIFYKSYEHNPKRILFQFHPHPEYELKIFKENLPGRMLDCYKKQIDRLDREAQLAKENIKTWTIADEIICASNVTKKSLMHIGIEEKNIHVIPYGYYEDTPDDFDIIVQESFNVLFVGSGIPRKGLYDLLNAWKESSLPIGSRLTLVCRTIEPFYEKIASELDSVCLIKELSTPELKQLYRSSSLFVMPSLMEGFGQVYLEAMSNACPVLGTVNTVLPDLGTEKDGVFLTDLNNTLKLKNQLEYFSIFLKGNIEIKRAVFERAKLYTWKRFRSAIQKLL